jgi:two-component system, OmpR family, sensor kinase
VFTGLQSRLMLSFSLLLLVCLCLLTITFAALFFVWVGLPNLAYARLTEVAVPMLADIEALRIEGQPVAASMDGLRNIASQRGARLLIVAAPAGTVLADTSDVWVGNRVRANLPTMEETTSVAASFVRGRLRGPDRSVCFYVAIPIRRSTSETTRTLYLVWVLRWGEAARPFVSSLLASVLLSGACAFGLSVLLALWLARSLAGPLQRTAEAAERVAAGDYTTSLDIRVPDEARRLAQSFNTMTRAVEASQRSQRDFVANVSHELKTPLTSIQGFAQAILDGTAGDEPAIHRAASVIQGEAERLSRMVGRLLDLARLESGEASMTWSTVDLAQLLRSSADRLALLADQRQVRLTLDLPDSVPIIGDGDRLTEVLTNLIDNSLSHTDPGGRVGLAIADVGDDSVTISVTDTGHGIPAEDLPRIFERFYQVDKSRSRQTTAGQPGVGLGLAIVSEIIRAHSGHVNVESVLGVGSRFTVTLPRHPERAH